MRAPSLECQRGCIPRLDRSPSECQRGGYAALFFFCLLCIYIPGTPVPKGIMVPGNSARGYQSGMPRDDMIAESAVTADCSAHVLAHSQTIREGMWPHQCSPNEPELGWVARASQKMRHTDTYLWELGFLFPERRTPTSHQAQAQFPPTTGL